MRIQNNIMALNAHRQYNINQSGIAKSTEKLSSGYRINRAGDDAAGLAISEKMRAQIRGLTMASKNSQDAISMVQTAEGALQETHNILQRMRELAVQSSSDTNETSIDRAALQQEYQNLLDEINDISTTTRFNDQNLLDGTFQKMLHTTNTAATTLQNVNALSVTRAGAGEYQMSVASSPASPSTISPGAACLVNSANMTAMADRAAKVASVAFQGLETSAHDGNTYTLKVSGSDVKNMTFQLIDSNGDIVSTAQNVNTSEWKAGAAGASGNVVNFKGVGSLTFTLEDNQVISNVTDLDTMSGAEMKFLKQGDVVSETTITFAAANADAVAAKVNEQLVGGQGIALTFTAGPGAKYATTDESPVAPAYTMSYSLAEDGQLTISVLDADGNALASDTKSVEGLDNTDAAGTFATFDLGDYGSFKMAGASSTATALNASTVYTYSGGVLNPVSPAAAAALEGVLSNVASDSVKTSFTVGSKALPSYGKAANNTPEDYSVTYSMDGDGVVTAKLMQGTTELATGTVTIAGNTNDGSTQTFDINLGDYGTFTISVTDDDAYVAAANPLTEQTVSLTLATPFTADGGTTQSSFTKVDEAAITGVTSTASPFASVPFDGGKAQEATPAARASMTLTINGESVVLHKGDTYANFADQGISFSFDALSDEDILNSAYFGTLTDDAVTIAVNGTQGKSMIIQSGANQGDELAINIDRISTETLGLSYSNISTHEAASQAITEVNNAINQVSTQRAALGALQNRLDHKIANLDTSAENLTAAEARIRDVDMAKEMTNFTKNNILFQASTAMLAQANAAPQGVLQLLS